MRNSNLNVDSEAIDLFSKETQLAVYEKIQLVRLMELYIVKAKEAGIITCSLYLSSGQEAATAALSMVLKDCQIFAQHRSGDTYLNFGGSPEALRDELLGKDSGCSGGKGGHIGIQWHGENVDMYGDNLLIGQCVPRAVGAALANGRKTLCIFGDGAGEEDYVLESLGFAATHKLPIVFICTDNDLAILTRIEERRDWSIVDIARGFGMRSYDVADDPWTIMKIIEENKMYTPILLNIRVCREYWHVGTGVDGPREWERETIVKEQLKNKGYENELLNIDEELLHYVKGVWNDVI